MSPQIAAEERLRRLAPLVAAVAALAMGLAPSMAATPSEAQVAAAVLVAVAAGLVAHAIAAARGAAGAGGGASGGAVVGGAVAGVWMAAVATTSGGVAGDVWAAATLAAAAGAVTMLARAAMPRGASAMAGAVPVAGKSGAVPVATGDDAPPLVATVVAVALVVLEPRAWAVAGAIAALVVMRDRGRRRLLAIPALMAAIGGGVVTLFGALGRAPSWAPGAARMGGEAWLEGAVDVMGPLAMVLAAVGVMSTAGERRARWLAAAIVAAMAALVPLGGVTAVRAEVVQGAQLAPVIPPTALIGAGLALGVTVAAAAARLGRPRHQMVAAAAITALMIAPFAL